MAKFLFLFFILLLGVHEALLQASDWYMLLIVIFIAVTFFGYMLWYFVYFRPYSRKFKRLMEELEYVEFHLLLPDFNRGESNIYEKEELNGDRSIFYFKVQQQLFGSLCKYGDNGGLYLRLRDLGKIFGVAMALRDPAYSRTFVALDPENPENSDFKILQKYVSDLYQMFNSEMTTDALEMVKTFFFHLKVCVPLLFGGSGRTKLDDLLSTLYDIVREIELAADGSRCDIKNNIDWFNFRLQLLADGLGEANRIQFEKYWAQERPANIADDIIAQLKQLPDDQDILMINYPDGWDDLAKKIDRYLHDRGASLRLYTTDSTLTVRHASIIYREPEPAINREGRYILDSGRELNSEQLFDFIICFNLMQHCTKAMSKAYYRRVSRLLADDGKLLIMAAISRDPKIDTFVAERVSDRGMMYLPDNIDLGENALCLKTPGGNISLLLQELDCNDGKISSLAKNIYLPLVDQERNNLYCGSILNIASKGRKMAFCLVREKYIFDDLEISFPPESCFAIDTENSGKKILIEVKAAFDQDTAYLNLNIDESAVIKMLKLERNPVDPPELQLAAAAEKLAKAFPPLLFRNDPDVYCQYLRTGERDIFAGRFMKSEFTAFNKNREKITLTFFLSRQINYDLDGYIFLESGKDLFVSLFPTKKLLSEEDFYNISSYSNLGKTVSATHQISCKTLGFRLKKIGCIPEKISFFSLGPQALNSSFASSVCGGRNVSQNIFTYIAACFGSLEFKKQTALLEDLDIHDVMVIARKKKRRKKGCKPDCWDLCSPQKEKSEI